MDPILNRLGYTGRGAAIGDSLLRAFTQMGVRQADAIRLLEWYARTFGPDGKVGAVDLAAALDYRRDIFSDEIINAALAWFETVDRAGGNPDVIPPRPAPDGAYAERRLAEIRALRRSNFDSYDADKSIQDEELMLLTSLEQQPASAPAPSVDYSGVTTPRPEPAPEQPAGLITNRSGD